MQIMSRGVLAGLAIAAFSVGANAQCQQIAGNYYCAQTDAITYNNVGFPGTYNQITGMDSTTCQCSSDSVSFTGGLAPLNEEVIINTDELIYQVSCHFRGPIHISQFAVYHRSSGSKKKREAEAEADPHGHGHGHNLGRRGHGHQHNRRQVTVTSTTCVTSTQFHSSVSGAASGTPSPSSAPAPAPAPATGGSSWTRDSYYNAATGEQDNVVFLNHLGGTNGSGNWDSCFGNTLSYANCDGVTGAQTSQTLGNVVIPSNNEVIAFTGERCDASCAYVREGTPAYKGFSTSSDTIFLFEFMMPRDPSSGFNVDMSAVWFLNGQIPRTLQYGNAACSCWTSGCGEFDVFEILSTGSDYLTTTLHTWQGTGTEYGGGGCSDYISRPVSSYMKAAVIFSVTTQTMDIVVIDPSTSFGTSLSAATVQSWCKVSGSQVNISG